MLIFLFALACKPITVVPLDEWSSGIRYRPIEPESDLAIEMVQRLPNAQWDRGLHRAAQELLASMPKRTSRVTPEIGRRATARAGFPGQVRYTKVLNGGAFPEELITEIINSTGLSPVDVALVRRDFGDGISLWLAAWAPHIIELDPLPLKVPLDGRVMLRAEIEDGTEAHLYLSPPMGEVQRSQLLSESHRWIPGMHIPGEWVFEIVTDSPTSAPEVAALFSIFVDSPLPELGLLPAPLSKPENPHTAEAYLYAELNGLRKERGVGPLTRFELFEPLAREHSAWMANSGTVSHQIKNITPGVPHHAANLANPRAQHYENVASAYTAEEAFKMAADSSGHLSAFLCQTCSHVSIGVALEPRLDGMPRIYVTWEMLDFVEGEPREIDYLQP